MTESREPTSGEERTYPCWNDQHDECNARIKCECPCHDDYRTEALIEAAMSESVGRKLAGFHQRIVDDVPRLKRGRVWCHSCGTTFKVDSAACLASGWPKCCGQTMSIDSPEERKRS